MPRSSQTPSAPKGDVKPYDRSSPSSAAKSPEGNKRGGPGRPWTGEEKLVIFDLAMKHGTSLKVFEGCLEGRTAKQCYLTWTWVATTLILVSRLADEKKHYAPGAAEARLGDGQEMTGCQVSLGRQNAQNARLIVKRSMVIAHMTTILVHIFHLTLTRHSQSTHHAQNYFGRYYPPRHQAVCSCSTLRL